MVQIQALNSLGQVIAEAGHADTAMLCTDRVWEDGDRILITSEPGSHLMVRMAATLPEGEVYLPSGRMHWQIPMAEHRLAYAPGTFDGSRHIVTARFLTADELSRSRDLARNPADLRGETDFYPHCTANVETRNEACFCARNVIDGIRLNSFHGEWPFQSWGIGAREDAWCRLDLGRTVAVEKMALTLRADFPHDAYWTAGHVVLSDGSDIPFRLQKTADRQWICLENRRVRWLRLERLVKSDDPSAFPALRQWEVFGRDMD